MKLKRANLMRFLSLTLLGLIGICSLAAAEPNSIPAKHQVILKGDWTPTKEQTEKALAEVTSFIREIAAQPVDKTHLGKYRFEGAAKISQSLPLYAVQFIGLNRNGREVVHCNFFPSPYIDMEFKDWQESQVIVDDGGYGFWQIDYDPELDKCGNLSINGPG